MLEALQEELIYLGRWALAPGCTYYLYSLAISMHNKLKQFLWELEKDFSSFYNSPYERVFFF
jgi:hypothetical protein